MLQELFVYFVVLCVGFVLGQIYNIEVNKNGKN